MVGNGSGRIIQCVDTTCTVSGQKKVGLSGLAGCYRWGGLI